MEIILLNSSFEEIHVLDIFDSLIWTDRYWKYGDTDIAVSPEDELLTKLDSTVYFRLPESESLMFFERKNIKADIEDGDLLILKGRSLESMLDRRRIWYPTILTGDFQTGIQTLLNENIINASDTNRNVSNLEFLASTDPAITGLTIDTQFWGESLYKAIADECLKNEVGFKITLVNNTTFRFELYAGKNRSFDQTANPYVEFSAELDNLIESEYAESTEYIKTVCLVVGEEGVGNVPTVTTVYAPGASGYSGLNRREMIYKPSITRTAGEVEMTDAEYLAALGSRGEDELAKNVLIKLFDGEVDTTMYKFGVDFFMGDIVQNSDKYGNIETSRVTEMIYSQDESGIKMYPAFTMNDD